MYILQSILNMKAQFELSIVFSLLVAAGSQVGYGIIYVLLSLTDESKKLVRAEHTH